MHPQRKSIRLPHYDYASPGMYFVTICTHERQSLFGAIDAGHVVLNAAGELAERSWHALPHRFPNLETDAFILMPSHLHAILFLYPNSRPNGGGPIALQSQKRLTPSPTGKNAPRAANRVPNRPPSLTDIICAFKSLSTISINKFRMTQGQPVWQRAFYDHIIRNADKLDALRRYIHENPARWAGGLENSYGEDFSIVPS